MEHIFLSPLMSKHRTRLLDPILSEMSHQARGASKLSTYLIYRQKKKEKKKETPCVEPQKYDRVPHLEKNIHVVWSVLKSSHSIRDAILPAFFPPRMFAFTPYSPADVGGASMMRCSILPASRAPGASPPCSGASPGSAWTG